MTIKMPTGCEFVDIDKLVPYERNPKNHSDKDVDKIVASVKRNGWGDPLLVCPETKEVLSGNGRLIAGKKLGLKEIPVVYAPKGMTEKQKADLVIASNKLVEISGYNENLDILMEEFELNPEDFGIDIEEEEEKDTTYTSKINIPQYEIEETDVKIEDLYDNKKSLSLISEILRSNLSDEEKDFLILASYRHIVFNYRNIAEYYAKASKECQDLMERSALVIIDYDDALKNGYTNLALELGDVFNE